MHIDPDTTKSFAASVQERGWAITPPIIAPEIVELLRRSLADVIPSRRGGARNLLEIQDVRDLATSHAVRDLVTSVLGPSCFAVRAILFDKNPMANWKVIWHQDLTIATRARGDVSGFGPWTEKDGVPHVQPPVSVLQRMLAIRVHLDPCRADNGPVRVIDGSHRLGKLSAQAISDLRRTGNEQTCLVAEGGVLAFNPMILHASSPSTAPDHRRVIHIEFAAEALPPPLTWHRQVS